MIADKPLFIPEAGCGQRPHLFMMQKNDKA
jgi:hypothetical protein